MFEWERCSGWATSMDNVNVLFMACWIEELLFSGAGVRASINRPRIFLDTDTALSLFSLSDTYSSLPLPPPRAYDRLFALFYFVAHIKRLLHALICLLLAHFPASRPSAAARPPVYRRILPPPPPCFLSVYIGRLISFLFMMVDFGVPGWVGACLWLYFMGQMSVSRPNAYALLVVRVWVDAMTGYRLAMWALPTLLLWSAALCGELRGKS